VLETEKEDTMRIHRGLIPLIAIAALVATASVHADAPNFSPAIYADGEVWGTKGLADLRAPNGHNEQSYDKLFVIVNGAPGQLPVAEAAPGNPNYNGGRWFTHTVMWTAAGMAAHNPLPVLMSYDDIMYHYGLGHLAIAPGPPVPGPRAYFECPLLPVK
jgi:hypothetical protein